MRKPLLVALLAVAALLVGGGTWLALRDTGPSRTSTRLVGPHSAQVTQAEQARAVAGAAVRRVTLTAAPARIDLGDRAVNTWAFNGTVPGPGIHATAGDVVEARVVNRLPQPLTMHWHGIALRNDMDGVENLTQKPIQPGATFTYRFTVPDAGTFWYHPHTGVQLDRGLYGALIVDPRDTTDQASKSRDLTLFLDDWIDGTGRTPDQVLADLKASGGSMGGMNMGGASSMPMSGSSGSSGMGSMDMPGMDMGGSSMPGMGSSSMPMGGSSTGGTSSPLGTDTADLTYPLYVVNGRGPHHPALYPVQAGETVRLRLVNAAAATPFRVAFGGSKLTVVATDGYPVTPVTRDALLIGMGERYDVEVTIPRRGAFPLVAVAEGQGKQALSVLRAGTGPLPAADVDPAALNGTLLTYADLHATKAAALPAGAPDVTDTVTLTGGMSGYQWGITVPKRNGVTLPVRVGQKVRLALMNHTMMWHPIHLHGHSFQLMTAAGDGPRKDTVIVPAMGSVTVELVADNPGQWLLHCHTIYHAAVGMMTTVNYVR